MPWIIAAVVILLLMARSTANATTSGAGDSGQDFRVQQLADAISIIEGGSPSNPGNIRSSNTLGAGIAENGDLIALINRAFISQTSSSYRGDMNFREFAWMYVAGTQPGNTAKVAPGDNPDNWASFVAGRLGVSVDSLVRDFLNS